MTKLESYQRGASFNATEFYADIERLPNDPAVERALEELRFHTKWVRLLGSYTQARPRHQANPVCLRRSPHTAAARSGRWHRAEPGRTCRFRSATHAHLRHLPTPRLNAPP